MVGRDVLWYETGNVRFDSRVNAIIVQARQIRERMGVVAPSTITDLSVVLDQLRSNGRELAAIGLCRRLWGLLVTLHSPTARGHDAGGK